MKRKLPAELLKDGTQQMTRGKAHPGRKGPRKGPSPQRELARLILAKLQARGIKIPTLEEFLAVIDSVDLQAVERLRAELRRCGLTELDQATVDRLRNDTNPQVLRLVDDL